MLLKEIEFPRPLLRAAEQRRLVIFAGAGVSMPAPSHYPSFQALAIQIGSGSPLSWEEGERLERYLGRLETAHVAVHQRAIEQLTNPASRPTPLHHSLVQLFPSSDDVRLVTTNFDTHFTAAASDWFSTGPPKHYQAPALPVGSRFKGIVHIHGSVLGASNDLVLTDADYGRAYLTEGWARRFLLNLFSAENTVVLFVGYSADDPPVQYLARALPVEGADRRFALTSEDRVDIWRHLGIAPVSYSKRTDGTDPHGALVEAMGEWVRYAHLGALGHEARISEILSGSPPLAIESESYLLECLSDTIQRRFFIQHATSRWLEWAQKQGLLPILVTNRDSFDESQRDFSRWCARQICQAPEFLLTFLARSRSVLLTPIFWRDLLSALAWSDPVDLGPERGALIAILLHTAPAGDHRREWLRLLERTPGDAADLVLALVDELLRPRLEVNAFAASGTTLELSSEQSFQSEFRRLAETRIANLIPRRPALLAILERHLRVASAFVNSARPPGRRSNALSRRRSAIEPHEQNFDWSPLGALIDTMFTTLASVLGSDPATARALIERWSRDQDDQLFVRLAIDGVRRDAARGVDERIAWLIERDFLYCFGLKHEVFELLRVTYPTSSEDTRRALINAVERGDLDTDVSSLDPDDSATREYEIYNVLVWLNRIAPDCVLAKGRLELAQTRNPTFTHREYPDLDAWVGPVTSGTRGSPDEWLGMAAEEAVHRVSDWHAADSLAEAVARDIDWSWNVVAALERDALWRSELHWHGLLLGWGKALVSEQAWSRVLAYLIAHLEDLHDHLAAMADLLLGGVRSEPRSLPDGCRSHALELARRIVDLSWKQDEAPAVATEDIVTQAINHSVGKIAEFWVHVAEDRATRTGTSRTLVPDVAADVEQALEPGSNFTAYTVAVLLGQLPYLYSLDSVWAGKILLPKLDWSRNPTDAEAAWHGFLTWGRWTRELLPKLLQYYVQTCARLTQLPEQHKSTFAGHVASIFVYGASEKDELLNCFLSVADSRERTTFARSVGRILRNFDDKEKAKVWTDRLDSYWAARQQGIPMAMADEELLAMFDWIPNLEPVLDSVVERVCKGDAIASNRGSIFYALVQDGLVARNPEAVYQLVRHLLPAARPPFYACSSAEDLVRALHGAGIEAQRLKSICEGLALAGCDSGRVWSDIGGLG